jgi:arginyl-tRNA synthetase
MQELQQALKNAARDVFNEKIEPELNRPAEQFGDYATNLALQLAPKLNKNPQEIAQILAREISRLPFVAKAEMAGPGFLNIRLTDESLHDLVSKVDESFGKNDSLKGQVIVLEHTDPNPFKEFHIGHAYSNTIGLAIGKLLEASGAEVHQVSYHGDAGLHIAMAVWAIGEEIKWQTDNLNPQSLRQRLGVDIGLYYARGAEAYKNNPVATRRIEEINQQIYQRDNPTVNAIYDNGRQWSLELFEVIYERLGTKFEKNYFESETAQPGIEVVKQNIGKVFQQSDGAIIYDGEKVGLHKRVFVTKQGLPTYEAKEIGLAFAKQREYPNANSFIVVTANEIDDYFRVLLAALKEIDEKLGGKIRHLSHGVVKFPEGKMSSRTGNIKLLTSLETDIEHKLEQLYGKDKADSAIVLGAIKFEFLKHRIGSDFVFDVEQSVSLQGNSGPYLQYAHARAKSILNKSGSQTEAAQEAIKFDAAERSLARKISEYPEVVQRAGVELLPSHISTYLHELAQNFNHFYETSRIIGDPRQDLRLNLVKAYALTLKNGLSLLNIAAPEHM